MIAGEPKNSAMGSHPNRNTAPPATSDEAGTAERSQAAARDRRAIRAVDLTDEDIAAIEASEMALGFEHFDAELGSASVPPLRRGLEFIRQLRLRGRRAKTEAVDKAFRGRLYDDT
jgi:hypothetical protein